MKLDRGELLARLDHLKPAIHAGGAIPELGHLWFDGKYAYAYDGGLGIRTPLKTEFAMGLPSTQLLGLLKSSPHKEVELTEDDATLVIKLGKANMRLISMPYDRWVVEKGRGIWEFPNTLPKNAKCWKMTEEFLEGLRRVLLIKPNSPQRVEHHGVVVVPGKGSVDLYTTDTRTLARCFVPAENYPEDRFIIPRPFAEQVVRQCEPGASLYVLADCLVADGTEVRLYSHLLGTDELVDLSAVITRILGKKEDERKVDLPSGLSATLERAMVLAGGEEAMVKFTVSKDKLKVEGHFQSGDVSEILDAKGAVAETATFRADLVKRGLAEADGIALLEQALVLYGGETWLYLVASR